MEEKMKTIIELLKRAIKPKSSPCPFGDICIIYSPYACTNAFLKKFKCSPILKEGWGKKNERCDICRERKNVYQIKTRPKTNICSQCLKEICKNLFGNLND